MENKNFPKIELVPVVDWTVDKLLWVGRLLTRQIGHEPRGSDYFVPDPLLDAPDHEPWVRPPEA